jgi:hypothetical protein
LIFVDTPPSLLLRIAIWFTWVDGKRTVKLSPFTAVPNQDVFGSPSMARPP